MLSIKKLFLCLFIFLPFNVFSMEAPWKKNLSEDSRMFLDQLNTVLQEINQDRPGLFEQIGKSDFNSELAQTFINNVRRFEEECRNIQLSEPEHLHFELNSSFPGSGTGDAWKKIISRTGKNDFLKYECKSVSDPFILYLPTQESLKNPGFLVQILKRSKIAIKCSGLFKTLEKVSFEPENVKTKLMILISDISKKTFPLISDENKIFQQKFVASADSIPAIGSMFCDYTGASSSICIYNKEEMPKAIIHETNHCVYLDSLIFPLTFPISYNLAKEFAIKDPNSKEELKDPFFSESFVEGVATILNIIITAQELSSDQETFNETFQEMWQREKIWGIFQSAKMLYLSGFKSFKEFLEPEKTEKRILETTAAVEYHILKAVLIYNPAKFLKIILKSREEPETGQKQQEIYREMYELNLKSKNHEIEMGQYIEGMTSLQATIDTLNKPLREARKIIQNKLRKLLLRNCKDEGFTSKVDAFLNWFWQKNPADDLAKTGRMTLIEEAF